MEPEAGTTARRTRRKTPSRFGSKRTSFVPSVPTTVTDSLTGCTARAMLMFMSPPL